VIAVTVIFLLGTYWPKRKPARTVGIMVISYAEKVVYTNLSESSQLFAMWFPTNNTYQIKRLDEMHNNTAIGQGAIVYTRPEILVIDLHL